MGGHNEQYKELIDRCKVGDIKAQYSLYKLFSKGIYNVTMRFMNNKMDADEIVQDTFISAFKKINDYEGKGTFGQWLKRIAVNNCISLLRKRKIHFEDIETVKLMQPLIYPKKLMKILILKSYIRLQRNYPKKPG